MVETMKNIARRMLYILLSLSLLAGISPAAGLAAADRVPGIIYVPWHMAAGDISAVYGGYFDDLASTEVAIQPASSGGQLSPDTAAYKIKPLNVTEGFVQFEVPAGIPDDVWAVWVKNGKGWSAVEYTNRAILYWVNEHQIYPGQKLLLHGRNMANPQNRSAQGVQVKFTDAETGAEHFGAVYDLTDFSASFTAPADLEVGRQYDISYTNGAGGSLGWVPMEQPARERVTVVAFNDNIQYFNTNYDLNVSWVQDINTQNIVNVQELGAKGDGITNDTAAVQMAVDKAALAGGGIVYFPNGTYIVDMINIGANTVLQGESKAGTVIQWSGADTSDTSRTTVRRSALTPLDEPGYGEANKLIYSETSNVGVLDMTLLSEIGRPNTFIDNEKRLIYGYIVGIAFFGWDVWGDAVLPAGQESTKGEGYIIKNVDIKLADGTSADIWAPKHLVIEDCNFDVTHYGIEVRGTAYNRIRNNTIKNVCRPIVMWQSTTQEGVEYLPDRSWFQGNTLIGDNLKRKVQRGEIQDPGWQELTGATEHRGTDFEGDDNLLMGNTFEGTIGDYQDNSGEGFQGQTGKCKIVSPVAAAAEDSLDSRKEITAISFSPGVDYVVITNGTGLGQIRKIREVKNNTIYVAEPWDVIPDETSVYMVNPYMQANFTLADNVFAANNNKGSIHFYRCGYNAAIRDNDIRDGGGIWMAGIQGKDNRLDVQYFMDVDNNKIVGSTNKGHGRQGGATAIGPGMDGGIGTLIEEVEDTSILSTLMYGIRITHNELTGIGTTPYDKTGPFQEDARAESSIEDFAQNSGIVSSTDAAGVNLHLTWGEIIDGNNVKNTVSGLKISKNSADTIVRNNDFTGNGTEISEVTPSVNTMYLEGDGGKKVGTYDRGEIDKSMLGKPSTDTDNDTDLGDDFYFEDENLDGEGQSVFADVTDHWARQYIEALAQKNVVSGKGDGLFVPEDPVTRAEFVAMTVRALGLAEGEYNGAYYDVFKADWYAPAMQAAKSAELIPEAMLQYNKAFPLALISRQEAAAVMAQACKNKGKLPQVNIYLGVFDDEDQIAAWARESVSAVYALDVMRGTDLHTFAPAKSLTRAEAAVLIYNLMRL